MPKRIKLLLTPERLSYDEAVARLRECCSCVDEFLRNRACFDHDDTYLKKIAEYVRPGVYVPGENENADPIAVLGITVADDVADRERVVSVRYAQLRDYCLDVASAADRPLLDTEGFLCPIVADRYRGQRFVRVGEFVV